MQIPIIIAALLAIAFIPLLLYGSWFCLSLTSRVHREPSYFWSFLSFLVAVLCFLLVCFGIFLIFTAMIEGSIDCPDGRRFKCNAVYEIADNPIEFWSVIAYRYFGSLGLGVFAICSYDLSKKQFPKRP
jgi:hypothetical protein